MRKTKELSKKSTNKGITLIALVITIIVMLILVAVTITMAVNGGLFQYAQNAGTQTNGAIANEQLLANGGVTIGNQYYNSINEFVNSSPAIEVHNWTRTGDDFKCSHCNAKYTMGEVISYTPDGATTATLLAEKSGLDKRYENTSKYPSSSSIDSNTGTQTIERQNATWVVLGIEDTNGNGTKETLLITTQAPVPVNNENKNLYFYDEASYNNAPSEIDRICKEIYSNSQYGAARGISADDVNNVLNYTPTGGIYYNSEEQKYYYTDGLSTSLSEIEEIYNYFIENEACFTPDGRNTPEALGQYKVDGYYYSVSQEDNLKLINVVDDIEKTITDIERNIIFGSFNQTTKRYEYSYYLSTSGALVDKWILSDGPVFFFGVGVVTGGNVNAYSIGFMSLADSTNASQTSFLRPVVVLMDELPDIVDVMD